MRGLAVIRWSVALVLTFANFDATSAVYRCTHAGKTVYSDQPCGPKAQAVPIPRPRFVAGDKLQVAEAVVDECFQGYRRLSRDPSAARRRGHIAEVAPAGIAVLIVLATMPNGFGGMDSEQLWCKLTDDLQIDRPATEKRQTDFYIEQQKR
jgi:hypothetical protein